MASAPRIARVTAHPLRAVLPSPQQTSQGAWTAIEIVAVEIETSNGIVGAGECLARRGSGRLRPLHRAGGISETWRITELAQSFNVAYAPHVGWSGALCVAASLQLAAAAENFLTFECMVYDNPLRQALLRQPVGEATMLKDGKLPIPDGPGLGVELDKAVLEAPRIKG